MLRETPMTDKRVERDTAGNVVLCDRLRKIRYPMDPGRPSVPAVMCPPGTEMSSLLFAKFAAVIRESLGIKMPAAKKTMLQSRLLKRLRRLGMDSFEEYYAFLFTEQGQKDELGHFITAVTTHKTDFFREPKQFDFLVHTALPQLIRQNRHQRGKVYRVWSAACSTGEEPYTLAMVLADYAEQHPGFQYTILATDISPRVLETAALGIYDRERVAPAPERFKRKYVLVSRNRPAEKVRICAALRAKVRFKWINLTHHRYPLREKQDIIFCRNVIIYFDRPTQERVLGMLCQHLEHGGYLFMGHSETLNGLRTPLTQVGPIIYQKV